MVSYRSTDLKESLSEDPPSTGSDVEKQLLEAAKSGDMELVKVNLFGISVLFLFIFMRIIPCAPLEMSNNVCWGQPEE